MQARALHGLVPGIRPEQFGRDHDLRNASCHPHHPVVAKVPRRLPVRTGRILPHYRTTLARPGISTTLTRDRPKPTDPAGDQLAVIIFGDRARPPYPTWAVPIWPRGGPPTGPNRCSSAFSPGPSTPSRTWVIILSEPVRAERQPSEESHLQGAGGHHGGDRWPGASPRVARCQVAATCAVPPLRGATAVCPFTSGAVLVSVRPPPRQAPRFQVRRVQALHCAASRARGAGRSAPTAARRIPARQPSPE